MYEEDKKKKKKKKKSELSRKYMKLLSGVPAAVKTQRFCTHLLILMVIF